MPIHPVPLPPNLHNLLSSLRSPIFLTAHNPTGARLASKYLKKPLIGPSILSYYPPRYPKIRELNLKFANFLGDRPDGQDPKRWANPSVDAKDMYPEGWAELMGGVVRQDRMFRDEREEKRVEKVASRRLMGRGAPKKGQGKRAQMGKKR